MARKERFTIGTGEDNWLDPNTTTFFRALSELSARPGGVQDLSWHVKELSGHPDTATAFEPFEVFNNLYHSHGFATARDHVDLMQPDGVPVDVIRYDEEGNPFAYDGKVVALLDPYEEENGAFTGLAVTDLGGGPEVVDVAFRSSVPGIVYHVE